MTESIVKYEPNSPVRSAGTLKSLLEANSASIATLLPKHVTPERIIKTLLVAVNRNPALLQCTQSSIFETIQRSAELGLDLSGTLGEAYPVPYKDKCQLIVGYRGLAKLARQSGEIAHLEAEAVFQNDTFVYEKGTEAKVRFVPKLTGERGPLVGFYAYAKLKDGGQQADYMTLEEVRAIQARSRSGQSGPWTTDFSEMGRKTIFRRLAKWLPLSSEKLTEALETDSMDFEPIVNQAKNVTPPSSITEALDRVAAKPEPVEPEAPTPKRGRPQGSKNRNETPDPMMKANVEPEPITFMEPEPHPASPPPNSTGHVKTKESMWRDLATKVLGPTGPATMMTFVNATIRKPLDQLTDAEEDKLDSFLNECAMAAQGEASGSLDF